MKGNCSHVQSVNTWYLIVINSNRLKMKTPYYSVNHDNNRRKMLRSIYPYIMWPYSQSAQIY